jgi:hypothetical protein
MAITLDGNAYSTYQKEYRHHITTPGATTRAVNFAVVRQTGGSKFATRYELTLRCTLAQLGTLKTTFAKQTSGSNLLNFVDEESFNWNPSAGSNDATHAYSTGVYFVAMGEPRPVTGRAWDSNNRYLVDIALVVNASGMAS